MGILDTVKDTVSLIQKVDNIDLYRRMLALQTEVFQLYEENRVLKEQLATREQLTFRGNSYWKGDDGPFCSRCWDAEGKLVRLHVQKGRYPSCPSCTKSAADPNESGFGFEVV